MAEVAAPEAPAAETVTTPATSAPAPAPETPTTDDWRAAHLPEDIRGEAVFSKYKSLPEALKAHVALSKQQGGTISIPKEGAPPEEWNRVYDKLGRPEKPEGYQIALPEKLPEGMAPLSEPRLASFRAAAHAAGMTQSQVAAAAKWFMEDQAANGAGIMRSVDEGRQAAVAELKKEWGPLFDRNRGLAISAFERFGSEADRVAFEERFGDDPVALRFLSSIGDQLMEKGEITGDTTGLMSPESAQQRLDQIKSERIANRKHPLNNPADPAYEQLLAETRALRAIALRGK